MSKKAPRSRENAPERPRDSQDEFFGRFAHAVAEARQTRNLSQSELATRAGLNRNYVSRLEKGELACNLFAAYRIAKALGVSLMTLCESH